MSRPEADKGVARGLVDRNKAIIGQGAWVFTGQAMTGLLNLAGTRLITQFVNPEIYGLVNLLQNATVLLRTLFCSPMLNAGLRYFPEAQHGGFVAGLRAHLTRSLGASLMAMEVITIGSALYWCSKSGTPPTVVLSLGVFVAADVCRTFEMSLFNAARRQRPAALLSIAETLTRPLLIIGGVLAFGPRIDVIFAALAASIVVTLAGLYVGLEPVGTGSGGTIPERIAAEMRQYAIPLIPIAFMTWITSVSDRYVIEGLSHDTSSVGIYAAGYGLISQPFLLLHGVVALTLRPAYFSAVVRGDDRRARQIFANWLLISVSACVLAVALVFAVRGLLVGAFLGPQYRAASAFVPWIALGYLFYVVEQVLEQHLLAHKRTRLVLVAQTCGAVASVAVTIPFVMRLGAIGAAYACPIYFLIQCLVAAALLGRSPVIEPPTS